MEHDALVKAHMPLVKRIAHHLMGRLPNNIQVDDLIQVGMIGLMDAAEHFNADKGASFETYAGIRIRGSMLDEVRRGDWVPRSIYRNARMISEASQVVEHRNGRDANVSEIAQEMGVSIQEIQKMQKDSNDSRLHGFDDVGISDDNLNNPFANYNPENHVEREEFCQQLTDILDTLSEREQLVLSLYYDEELNLKEIGTVLEVSESRVCQIHSQAMKRIREKL